MPTLYCLHLWSPFWCIYLSTGCLIAIFSLNLFLRSDFTFSHCFGIRFLSPFHLGTHSESKMPYICTILPFTRTKIKIFIHIHSHSRFKMSRKSFSFSTVSNVDGFLIKKEAAERDPTCPISTRPWLKNNFGYLRSKDEKPNHVQLFMFPILEKQKEHNVTLCEGF